MLTQTEMTQQSAKKEMLNKPFGSMRASAIQRMVTARFLNEKEVILTDGILFEIYDFINGKLQYENDFEFDGVEDVEGANISPSRKYVTLSKGDEVSILNQISKHSFLIKNQMSGRNFLWKLSQ